MHINRLVMAAFITLSAGSFCTVWSAQAASHHTADTDGDGSISLDEAHSAATKKFDAMDSDHTGKLTQKQASPMSKSIQEMVRHDKDQSVNKEEYMAGVDAAFKEADPKGSGVLNAAALKTPAGKRFLELVE